jgi:hypothetical protein
MESAAVPYTHKKRTSSSLELIVTDWLTDMPVLPQQY